MPADERQPVGRAARAGRPPTVSSDGANDYTAPMDSATGSPAPPIVLADVLSAAVHCAPPGNRPTPEERDACLPYSVSEWGLLSGLRVVVCLGGVAQAAGSPSPPRRRLRWRRGSS